MFSRQKFLEDYFYLQDCRSSEGWRYSDNKSYCGLSTEANRNMFWVQFKIGHHWLIVSGNRNANVVEAFRPEECCSSPSLDFRRGCEYCGMDGRRLAGPAKLIQRNNDGFSYRWLDLETAANRLAPLLTLDAMEVILATEEIIRFMEANFPLKSTLAAI